MWKLPGPGRVFDRLDLLAVLHMQADRRQIGMIHAGIHGEDEFAARHLLRQPGELSIGRPAFVCGKQHDFMQRRVDVAECEGRAVEILRPAWSILCDGRREHRQHAGAERCHPGQHPAPGDRQAGSLEKTRFAGCFHHSGV